MLSIVGNDDLTPIAAKVRDKLAAVVERAGLQLAPAARLDAPVAILARSSENGG
jgi:hypothetical protein